MQISDKKLALPSAPSDEALCAVAQAGDVLAEEELLSRYNRTVRRLARPLYLSGGDSDDLIQEGMIGLMNAIRQYQPNHDAVFATFAETCIRNRLYSAVRAASREKHQPLNQSVPLEIPFFDRYSATFCVPPLFHGNPEDWMILQEEIHEELRSVRKLLSEFEAKILGYYLDGLTLREMAEELHRSPKSVDNAVQRIRHKIARQPTSGGISRG